MGKIIRDPAGFAKKTYDLIIIGGGIYGVMLSFEASRRGLKSLLLEKADFGGATTFNCLRIIHGGFRYLQTLDIHRFHESVAERRWFLKTFPGLVAPLPCLMPLYGNGLRRPAVLRLANWMNDTLSRNRNDGVTPKRFLPNGKILTADQTKEICPLINPDGLKGAVVWHDAIMPNSQRIVIELLRWACGKGASALNYAEAEELSIDGRKVKGVRAEDLESGESFEFKSNVVINAGGPWSRGIAAKFGDDKPELFISSIAWNVLFDKPAISSHAMAVTPKKHYARTYFLIPWKDKLLAGTGHAPWHAGPANPAPNDEMIKDFMDDLNFSVPALRLVEDDILHVFSGLLPVKKSGTVNLTKREVMLEHATHGGPQGLYSISGIKFTTSRLVAEKTIKNIFPERKIMKGCSDVIFSFSANEKYQRGIFDLADYSPAKIDAYKTKLGKLVADESVSRMDDLIFRRTNFWEDPQRIPEISSQLSELIQ